MIQLFKQWLMKLFEREAYIPIALIVIATAALFTEKASFLEWASACGGFAAVASGGILLKKRIEAGDGG